MFSFFKRKEKKIHPSIGTALAFYIATVVMIGKRHLECEEEISKALQEENHFTKKDADAIVVSYLEEYLRTRNITL